MGLARRTAGEQMPTRFWNFKRRGGSCRGFAVARLEGLMVFFSMSDSVEGGEEERRERCFRKGIRILRAIVRGGSNKIGRRSLSSPRLNRESGKIECALGDLGG